MRKIEDMFTPSKSVWRVFSVQEKNGFNVRVIDPNSHCLLGEHQLSEIRYWGAFDSPGQAQLEQQKVWEILRNDNPPGLVKFRNNIRNKIRNMNDTDKKVCIYTLGVVVGSFSTALQMALRKR